MSRKANLVYFLIAFLVSACNADTRKSPAPNAPSPEERNVVDTTPGTASNTTKITTPPAHFDSSSSWKENLAAGWMDTFLVEKRMFRMRYDSIYPNSNALIEERQNGVWLKNLSFPVGDDFSREDLNGDGYGDLSSTYQAWTTISCYDPVEKRFDTALHTLGGDANELLDRKRNLYMDWADVYHGCNEAISKLYMYKNARPYFYYELVYQHPCGEPFTAVKLYRFEKGSDTTFHYVRTVATKDAAKFDYRAFWKANYKKLLYAHDALDR